MMRHDRVGRTVSRSAARIGALAAVALAAAVAVPLAASASTHREGASARGAATTGVVYGGRTAQGFPVMIEVNSTKRRVVQAVIGLRLTCSSGSAPSFPDRWINLTVNRKRKFSGRFGPETQRNPDGTRVDSQGSISGAFNRARTKVSGKWQLKLTAYDATGAVVDTCDTGLLGWSAKQ
jgi:hypothetical protein